MFDLCHHVLAASADIGIVMEYLMDVLKKFEKKKQKKKKNKSVIIFDYKRIQVILDSTSTGKKEQPNQQA